MADPEWMCASLRAGGVYSDCEEHWRQRWSEFWSAAIPIYDTVLMWDPTPQALTVVPTAYRVKYHADKLWIYERVGAQLSSF
jgi:hypothetical protein